ncbi:MAG: family 43 glycosylhydrolase [Oscillospiraceae bacterium]|nr:family 43 glycosylhydrolase [Oscillospiraceae bacterium]MDY2847972.1 family 43 glycosylhydrolase [Oscillospiraceae bacterium]
MNPYLPSWEYIPDGEPRVFGDRIYIYGSHDTSGSDRFCDYVLKCWSAPLSDLGKWVCHGDIFHTRADRDHPSDIDWNNDDTFLFAPDVVRGKDGKYYLYAYIVNGKGCVAVSDKPEGPFKLISQYKYTISDEICCNGWFIDPGVLVDDDGRTYIYCGFERSFLAEINSDNMYEVIDNTCIEHFIPCVPTEEGGFSENDSLFFEACSPRKINGTYYMIYSPKRGSRLAYATSDSPTGPYTYRGYIVDNGVDYPGGNNHGSIACINGQWYVFYHRMTNGTIMSRRGCVEKIGILPDGTIPPVEMTSLGFEDSLDPYEVTPADIACVLRGSAFITERNVFERYVANIHSGDVIGYKYYDFGSDFSSRTMEFAAEVRGMGTDCHIHIFADDEEIGVCDVGPDGGVVKAVVKAVTGRHAVYLKISADYSGWTGEYFKDRALFELIRFVFMK